MPGFSLTWNDEALKAKIREDAGKRAQDLAVKVAGQAKVEAPVDTGKLKASIHVEAGESPQVWYVVADTSYAKYVELGTYRTHANPFLTRAFLVVANRERGR